MSKSKGRSTGRKLIVLGQTPPPFHGQAVAIKAMVDGLAEKIDIVHVPMRFSETVFDNGRMKYRKLLHLFSVVARTLYLLILNPGSVLYYPPAPAYWVPIIRDLVILSLTRPFASKTIFHFHAHGIGEFLRHKRWLSWPWWRPDHAIVLCKSCWEDAQLLAPINTSVIPYGVNLVPATRKRSPSNKVVVLYVGMLTETKGLFDLLETASELRDLDVEFRLVGTYKHCDTQPRFEARRSQLQLEKNVITVGKRSGEELWQEYADADIFFFPTYFETETFGIVVLEAMSHSLPVVASFWRGPKDIVNDGETGLLCKPRDTLAYAKAIRMLVEDRDFRIRMGCKGKALCEAEFTMTRFLSSMEEIFSNENCRRKFALRPSF